MQLYFIYMCVSECVCSYLQEPKTEKKGVSGGRVGFRPVTYCRCEACLLGPMALMGSLFLSLDCTLERESQESLGRRSRAAHRVAERTPLLLTTADREPVHPKVSSLALFFFTLQFFVGSDFSTSLCIDTVVLVWLHFPLSFSSHLPIMKRNNPKLRENSVC